MAPPRRITPRGRSAVGRRPDVPGYRLGPPIGYGCRGAVWSANREGVSGVAGKPSCAVALVVGDDAAHAERQRRRLATLVGAPHANLAEVLEVVPVRGGCAVVSERIEGPTLAALRLSRPPLSLPEVAGLLGPLARALAHLHRHGVTHGDVSPANVVLTPGATPVLVDLVGEVTQEGGTPGFAAPERLGSPADPAGDVWSLATVGLWLVGADDRAYLRDILSPALALDPDARCSASALALLADGLGAPAQIALPAAPSLAQASVRARGAMAETRPPARRRHGGPRLRLGRASGRHRARRRGLPAGAVATSVVLVLLIVGFAIPGHDRIDARAQAGAAGAALARAGDAAAAPLPNAGASGSTLAQDDTAASASPIEPSRSSGPELDTDVERELHLTDVERELDMADVERELDMADVERLLRDRDLALASGDGSRLVALTVPGSAAALADAPLVVALDRGYRAAGLRTTVQKMSLLAPVGTAARVEVRTIQSEHRRISPGGAVTAVAARAEECAVLVLAVGRDLRLQAVEPCLSSGGQAEGPPSPSR